MPTNFDLAEATVNFAAGNEATWNNFVLPVPENVIVYTVDTKKFKKGDGNHRFSELPDGPSIAGIASGEESVSSVLVQLGITDEDSIIVIEDELYKASTTKLSTLLARLTAVAGANTIQTANLDAIVSQLMMVDASITSGDNGKLAIVGGNKMKPGILPESVVTVAPVSPINIRSIKFYNDINLENEISSLYHSSIYYANVHIQHDTADIDNITIQLTDDNDYVTIENVERGKFKIIVGQPIVDGTVQFTATGTYNADTVSVIKSINIHKYIPVMLAVYGGTAEDRFQNVVIDSQDNIICVGWTYSEGAGSYDGLVVKFDSSLNIVARKRYGGTSAEYFYGITTDSNDNIICVGYTNSEGIGAITYNNALVIKFDSSLNIIARKVYGGNSHDTFVSTTTNSNDDIICVGYTASEGAGSHDTLVVKFDSSLNIIIQKRYGGSLPDEFSSVCVDSSDNIICVGYTASEGAGSHDALVVKFDSSLNIIARKRYGGTGADGFYDTTVDSNDNIICVGYTASEGSGNNDALVVKFDSSLNIIARKRYGGTSEDSFYGVKVDSNDNIICAGLAYSESAGSYDGLIIKFNNSLNSIFQKRCGGISAEQFLGVDIDFADNIICVGYSQSEGAGSWDAFVIKTSTIIPPGSFTGTVLTGLSLFDSALTLADSNLTLNNSTLTLANATLTLADSNLTLANSAITLEKDTINI